ncbi:MAG: protein O-mannosyl-transferase family [Cytophagales bacterium]
MLSYQKINNITGWLIFILASAVYVLTVEPTASFWDCGEFIACAYKLQVPHPPGAPMFLLIGRLFSFLALGDVTKVAYWINISSALSSSATILFLFWSITLLARKLVLTNTAKNEPSLSQTISIIGAGAVGALAFAFSDTFWFSAVEAEVYAMSAFFTAFVFWAMLKWESIAEQEGADKWLLLIAYMVGLSIGVHLLNLVAIPALGFIYYFKRYKANIKGAIVASLISLAIVGLINNFIIPGLPTIAGKFEVLFTNNLGLPFGSGVTLFIAILISSLVYGIVYSIRKNNVLLNTGLLALTFVMIGYCSYAMILIRSNYNPPIDENNPEDVMSFVSYLKREQYGDRPLFYGPSYTAELVDQTQGEAKYRKGEKKYEIYDYKVVNKFDERHNMLFPRMHSKQPGHAEEYARWTGKPAGRKPSMGDNITFFVKYQLGHMYWRYFLWNFAGREGDVQDMGYLRPWDTTVGLPAQLANNKARNQFFMLPLALGLFGFVFQYAKSKKDFLVVALLFLFTGIVLLVYLNPTPMEPRERDYIFVGSFYAFAIWIGLGVLQIIEYLNGLIKKETLKPIVALGLCMTVPILMAKDGWDDHDRSQRYHSVDSAKNLLNSCAKNGIIFTGGDNDTFPLWYVQEVEGFRTDVRVCNLSLLNTDWYISQMKMKAYDSDALPISLEYKDYAEGTNDYVPFVENPQGVNGISLPVYIKLIKEQNQAIMVQASSGASLATLPSETLILPIDTARVRHMDFIPKGRANMIQEAIVWKKGRGALEKKDLIILDMMANNNWERPIYFSSTLSTSNYLGLREYMQMEGLAYRFMPFKEEGATQGFVNTDIMYDRLMNGMFWRNLNKEGVYYDENYRRFPYNARLSFYRLATELYYEGKNEKAKEVINRCFEVIPDKTIPYDVTSPQFVSILLKCGDKDKALEISNVMANRADEELGYYMKNNIKNEMDVQSNLYILNQLATILKSEGLVEESRKFEDIFRKYAGDNYQ